MFRRSRSLIGFALVAGALGIGWHHLGSAVNAQGAKPAAVEPITGQAVAFARTEPLRDIAAREAGQVAERRPDGTPYSVPNRNLPRSFISDSYGIRDVDPVISGVTMNGGTLPPPLLTFAGLANADNTVAFGGQVYPPDTNGDVGPNHYVQMVNLLFRIFNKAGAPLIGPTKLSSLFAPLGGLCSTNDNGDPVVVYDELADRWLLSQFGFSGGGGAPPYYECVALSQTADPTGAYYVWAFVTPGSEFPDYPKFGVWPDAYYMTVNQFTNGAAFNGTGAYAFNRAKMLAGDPASSFIYFNLNLASHPEGIGGMLPSDLDGSPLARPNVFSYFTANEYGDVQGDALRMFEFTPNFTTPASSTFTELPFLPVAAFDPIDPSGRADIPQPGTAVKLDSITDRLLNRLQYRTFGGYESLVTNHTVDVSGDPTAAVFRAGPRWYELRRTLPGGAWTVQNQGSYAPADTVNRWMGSAAMDRAGDLAVGYSVSDAAVFPGIRYAGRLPGDAANTLAQGEELLIAGNTVQTGPANRWGDYSMLTPDPSDGCTFWYTQEYYATPITTTIDWKTRVGSFRFTTCTSQAPGRITGTVMNGDTATPFVGARISVGGIFYGVTGAGGTYSIPVLPGTYTISATAPFYTTDSEAGIVVTAPGPTAVPTMTINATGGTINVTVRNGATMAGLAGASVSFNAVKQGVTNGSGLYSATVAAGGFAASATYPGFTSASVYTGVAVAGTTNVELLLFARPTITSSALSNPAAITINDNTTATPYPSNIVVSGVRGQVARISVTLTGFSHTFPSDVDFLVKSPSGQSFVVLGDSGGGTDVVGANLTFVDGGAALPATIVSGTYAPRDGSGSTNFPAPGPGTTYSSPPPAGTATFASAFGGGTPNGTWSLFVVDHAGVDVGSVSGGWSITLTTYLNPSAIVDFEGNTFTDFAVTRNTAGTIIWHVLNSLGYTGTGFGDATQDIKVPADYDGDGKADIAVWRPSNGTFYLLKSSNGAFQAQQFGQNGDDPTIVGDYDGDGKADFAVYRPGATSVWWVLRSSDSGVVGTPFGQTGDKVVPGDYDGDGKYDFAIMRGPGAATYYIQQSTAGFFALAFGLGTDSTVPGDYDGDGKTDIAVARNVSGVWNHYIRRSSNGSLLSTAFGIAPSDVLTPGDYDGDGVTDIAVWRPSNGTYYALKSSTYQLLAQPWGVAGDFPVASFRVK